MSAKRLIAIFALLLLGFMGAVQPSHAQAQVVIGRLLLHGAKWLVGALAGYQLGKEIERATGEDFESKLKEAEAGLVAEIKKGSPDQNLLQTELSAVRSQLGMIDTLMRGRPTQQELEGFRQQLEADIERTREMLQDHGIRIEKLENDMTSVLARLDSLERASSSSDELIAVSGAESPKPTLGGFAWRQRGRRLSTGVTLEVLVTGSSSSIVLRETGAWETADLGSFSVSGEEEHAAFQLLQKTGAVIILSGRNHRVSMASSMCGRARVVDKSRGSVIVGCAD